MYSITNIGNASRFAYDIFWYLNGKINYMITAKMLLFGNNSMSKYCSGDMVLDVVEINIPNIFNMCMEEDGFLNESKIRGSIIYTIIHELLHIDQDMLKYVDLCNGDREQALLCAENACHALSFEYSKKITEGSYLYDIYNEEIPHIKLPSPDMYISSDLTTDQYMCWLNSYYRIQNTGDKGLYELNDFCDIDFRKYIDENCEYACAYIYFNDAYLTGGYIYYLDHWVSAQYIFDMLRPIILRSKAENGYTINIIERRYDNKDIGKYCLTYEIKIDMTNKNLDIVNHNE